MRNSPARARINGASFRQAFDALRACSSRRFARSVFYPQRLWIAFGISMWSMRGEPRRHSLSHAVLRNSPARVRINHASFRQLHSRARRKKIFRVLRRAMHEKRSIHSACG
jgi:hypothetical protein